MLKVKGSDRHLYTYGIIAPSTRRN